MKGETSWLIAGYLLIPRKSVTFTFVMDFIITLVFFFPCPSSQGSWCKAAPGICTGTIPQRLMTPHLVLPRAAAQGWPNRAGGSACQCLTQAQAKQQLPRRLTVLKPWHPLSLLEDRFVTFSVLRPVSRNGGDKAQPSWKPHCPSGTNCKDVTSCFLKLGIQK